MSEENVEIVRRIYERFSEGNFEAALGRIDPDVVFEDYTNTPERFVEGDAKVVVVQREVATHKGSGVPRALEVAGLSV